MTIIPTSHVFDQPTLALMLEHDPVVQHYREFFALLDWSAVPDCPPDPHRPGQRPHPASAYIKALLIKICEKLDHASDWRTYLVRHPLLVLEIGFRPRLNLNEPYGFEVDRTVPTARWLREKHRTLDRRLLQDVLAATVHALQEEIPGVARNGGLRRETHLCLG